MNEVKFESIDISEQFVADNSFHDREKLENISETDTGLSVQFQEAEYSSYVKSEDSQHQDESGFSMEESKSEEGPHPGDHDEWVKSESIDISEQFIDENTMLDRKKLQIFGDIGTVCSSEQQAESSSNIKSENPHHQDESGLSRDESNSEQGPHPSDHDKGVKSESIDISEQLIGGNNIHDRKKLQIFGDIGTVRSSEQQAESSSNIKSENPHHQDESGFSREESNSEQVSVINAFREKISRNFKHSVSEYAKNHGIDLKHKNNATDSKLKEHDYAKIRKDDLKQHIHPARYNLRKHNCEHCDYITNNESILKHHIDSAHSELGQHKCEFCDYVPTVRANLKKHIDSVHLNLRQHKCAFCDYAASAKVHLKRHIGSVHLKLRQHKCELCDYATTRREHLKLHIDSVHLILKQHKCELCEYSANNKGYLEKHIDSVHLKSKKHECSFCDYAGSTKYSLQRHIESVHLKSKEHECSFCDYAGSTKYSLQRHIDSVHLSSKQHK